MKSAVQTVLGHRIAEPRLTPTAYLLIVLYVGLPVLLAGMALDLLVQWLFGWCVGLWCFI